MPLDKAGRLIVALLAEGVDRNPWLIWFASAAMVSPSSRRAWIEIAEDCYGIMTKEVALLAEGVDRNRQSFEWTCGRGCRPPRGGRG